jgi:O-antigen ligase
MPVDVSDRGRIAPGSAPVQFVAVKPRLAARSGLCDAAIFWSFMAGLAWVPFWYGSNDVIAWGINALVFPGLAAGYEASLLVRGRRHPVGIKILALPAILFLAVVLWIAFQTLAWENAALRHPIWSLAAGVLATPLDGSITVNRDLTNLALVRLITAAAVFWLAVQIGRDAARAEALIRCVAVIGCGYAVYGLFALASAASYPPGSGAAPERFLSSTFVNHNSFASYANIGLVVIAGLVIELYQRAATRDRRLQTASLVEWIGRRGAAPLAGGFLIAVAVLLTGSRGGVIAAATGLTALAFLARRRGKGRPAVRSRHIAVLVISAVVVTAILAEFGDAFFNGLAERGIVDIDRLSVYLLTLRSILDAPFLGHGYGSFADVFALYRDRSIGVQGAWEQAHNTYLEIFQGLGLVFGSMLMTCVVLLVLRCIKGARSRKEHAVVPRVAAAAAVLIGSHALVDFGLQMQAVAITLMAVLGAGVAQSASSRLVVEDK